MGGPAPSLHIESTDSLILLICELYLYSNNNCVLHGNLLSFGLCYPPMCNMFYTVCFSLPFTSEEHDELAAGVREYKHILLFYSNLLCTYCGL